VNVDDLIDVASLLVRKSSGGARVGKDLFTTDTELDTDVPNTHYGTL
jgi:hypothetical protein